MNVFVLCAGRTASTTFAKAASLIDGYSAAHESRVTEVFGARLDYPSNHIEVDNRLAFFLGGLDRKYGDRAFYVHLRRDPEEIARSYRQRWFYPGSIVRGFHYSILMSQKETESDFSESCRFYVDTVEENIQYFLKDKTHVMEFDVARGEVEFRRFLELTGLTCHESAFAVWRERSNQNVLRPRHMRARRFAGKMIRLMKLIPTVYRDL